MFCSGYECIMIPKTPKCIEPFINVQGVCLKELPCMQNKDCDPGSKCLKYNEEVSICMPIGTVCYSDNDCPELMRCLGGICAIFVCRTDAHCSSLRACKNNICVPKPICQSDADCEQNQKCGYGYCYSLCEDECGKDMECINGICKV
jgi:hypothetical protein